jgi:2-polyprenyl-6-methoxyphenol hydroxylase-like FAD-dependent oxidoreductase
MMFFPMRGGDRFRVIATLPASMAAGAAAHGLTLDQVRALVRDVGGVEAEIGESRWSAVYRIHHRRAERSRSGRVFLAGLAAHVHSPAGGQGMNTGIGDAYNLAWKLARVVRGTSSPALTLLQAHLAGRPARS